jgi:membrane protease YdiL (CAAX protease family)
MLYLLKNQLYEKFLLYVNDNLKYLIWISSIIFGLMHLSNFHNFAYINLLGITEIIAGLFFCYITRKYNIFYSYFFYALNNSLPFFIIAYKLTT